MFICILLYFAGNEMSDGADKLQVGQRNFIL